MSLNPWVTRTEPATKQVKSPARPLEPAVRREVPAASGASAPQDGVPQIDRADQLGRFHPEISADLWVVGAHGGAGETTLTAWLTQADPGVTTRGAERRWPILDEEPNHASVVLVARTHARGLEAARFAGTEWASNQAQVKLLGLVLIGDAPGRLPKPLREQVKQLGGAVPNTWVVPYLGVLRVRSVMSDAPVPARAARAVRSVLTEITTKEK